MKSSIQVHKFLTAGDLSFTNGQMPISKKDTDAAFEFAKAEAKSTYECADFLADVDTKRLDSTAHIAFFIANKFTKAFVSESHFTSCNYELELISFLKTNGKLVYRKIIDAEVQYIFLYKNTIISTSVDGEERMPTMVAGYSVYHTVDVCCDFPEFEQFLIKESNTPKIGLIKTNQYGPYVSWIDFNSDQKFSEDYYNDDFVPFYNDLLNKLDTTKTGLFLFHGEPGTGKSSALKHLVSQINRPFVFIPPQMINCLSNPEFTNLVTTQLKGSVLIIEDAEKALMKRESDDGFFNSELVSTLLNLTDGLYAEMASTSIIATYNCDRNLIDPALLRKGRLKSEYKFDKLCIQKSQALLNTLGHDVDVTESMSLADIFNYEQQFTNVVKKQKRAVGFGA